MKKIRIAGPPGTGKTRFLVKLFYEHIQKYSATEILMTSHTNTAAKEIYKRILDDKTIQEYQDDTGKEIFHLVKESKETLKETVTTIHKYCRSKIKKLKGTSVVFNGDDYDNLKILYKKFNTHTGSQEFYSLDILVAGHPFFKFHNAARDNGLDTVSYYRTLSFEEKEEYEYTLTELQELEEDYNKFKNNRRPF